MRDREAILFANEAFYQAFRDSDIDTMDTIWAPQDNVTCIHPGWPYLTGRGDVMQSWMSILANPASPDVYCHHASVHQLGDTAYVMCYEQIEGNVLVATNVFVRNGRSWQMVHHQAGPAGGAPAPEDADEPSVN